MTNAVAIAQGGSNNVTFRNKIINGNMTIDQRNAGAAVTNGSGSTYFTDRWLMYDGNGGSHSSAGQNKNSASVLAATGFVNYLGFQTTSAVSAASGNNFTLNQYIEGYTAADLAWGTAAAKPVTLSFWVQSSLTGTFAGCAQEDGATACYVFTYTINSANTWEYKTISIPAATIGTWNVTNGRGINLRFDMGMGSSFITSTPNTWQNTNAYTVSGAQKVVGTLNATFYITGVQLEAGTTATPFEQRLYGTELALCQRYYYKNQASGTASYFAPGYCNLTTGAIVNLQFPVPMRTQPSALENAAAANFRVYSGSGTSTQCTSISFNTAETISCSVQAFVASGLTTGQGAFLISYNNTAYLAVSAEL